MEPTARKKTSPTSTAGPIPSPGPPVALVDTLVAAEVGRAGPGGVAAHKLAAGGDAGISHARLAEQVCVAVSVGAARLARPPAAELYQGQVVGLVYPVTRTSGGSPVN